MRKESTRKLVFTGLMIAVVFLATRFTSIPVGIGCFNVGDAAIMITAVFLGRNSGMAAGALGSALSDLLSPWAYYSPITLVVKGIEGYVIGAIAEKADHSRKGNLLRVVAVVAGAVVMVAGYFLGDLFGLKFVGQDFGMVLAVNDLVTTNLLQGAASVVLGLILTTSLAKANIKRVLELK